LTADAGAVIAAYPRLLVLAEPNSRATLVESYVSLSGEPHFNNAVTEIVLENGAALDHVKLLKEGVATFHMATTEVYQNRDSHFRNWSLALTGGWVRQDLHVALDAEGAACACDGLYLLTEGRHVDHHLLVDHWKPQGTSSQLYKGILEGKSTAVFNGKTFVHAGAQKTAATQTNKNLLLSENATVDTKPELEIYADDVKCSHGATVGQIDPEALFYFKSRGIGEARARQLICYGFAREVVEKSPLEAVRAELDVVLMEKLGA
jgi:Fe-S cluster assembly protein SufD